MDRLRKKEKGLMDMDSVVIAGRKRDIRALNGNGKNTIKIKLKKTIIVLALTFWSLINF